MATRLACALLVLALSSLGARGAVAAEVVRLVPAGVEAMPGRYAPAASSQDAEVRRRGAELERTVSEALEDMGLEVQPSGAESTPADGDLPSLAGGGWVVAPRIEVRSDGALVRIVALPPGSRVLLVREEELSGAELNALSARAVVMVRDLVESGRATTTEHPSPTRASRVHPTPPAPQSSGRAVLALNAALYGGYLGFTMQRASASNDGQAPADSRLVYPMVALGAGLGLGASLLVADEWNVSQGDAWYLAAGMYWPGASGFLIAQSYGAPLEDRYLYGLVGATSGVALGTVAVATSTITEGGAVLTHSGGAFGMLFGAMAEVAIDGTSTGTLPTRGMGFGTGVGALAAGAVATQVDVHASRMLFIDLSVSLGGLGAAALASPLVFEEPDATKTRLWLGAVAVGAIAGGVVGWYITDENDAEPMSMRILPYASQKRTPYGDAFDFGVVGTF